MVGHGHGRAHGGQLLATATADRCLAEHCERYVAAYGGGHFAQLPVRQAGAPEFAPVELAAAREKLALADKALVERKATIATQMAEQANADAQLAEAKAIQQKSHKAAVEFDASMVALRQESNRPTQPAQ